jgi:ribonucleoside-triphosphate reductase|nr:MAG TPA: anaerobic ribonucleoside triphosphate reductase [Caudoviricetes sp.]
MKNVTKRDGSVVAFDRQKIVTAIEKAMDDTPAGVDEELAEQIATAIQDMDKDASVEEIQDMVEDNLMSSDRKDVARSYIIYRDAHARRRDATDDQKRRYDEIRRLVVGEDEDSKKENSNKDTRIIPTMRDYMAGFTCRELATEVVFPKDLSDAHKAGLIHIHDTDYSPVMPMFNCDLINLDDMLQNGTVISKTLIEKPKSFRTACTVVTQIITQVASCQYGGNTISLAHLSPFIDISRQKIRKEVEAEIASIPMDFDDGPIEKNDLQRYINDIAEQRLRSEIKDGVQTIQYQLITMSTTNGQAPFTSMFMYLDEVPAGQPRKDLAMLIEEVLRQRIQGVKNEQGVYVTTAFPKLLYCLDEDNSHEDSEYWYLTKLAAECSAKRLVPDYISAKIMRKEKDDNVFPCMGCRSFLMPYYDKDGNPKFYGRFNQGVVTLNLPDIALSSGGDIDKFWEIFDERLSLCYRALMIRHNSLKGVKSDVAPILWQHGAIARLKPGETIDKFLYNDYSSISLGYAGLYECIHYMAGKSQLDKAGHDFGIQVMQHLNNACDEWKRQTRIGFSLYGSPIESTTFKFAKCLRKRFGIIPGITDKDYVTNSYHITPSQPVDAFTKLTVESEFQHYSLGGAISYVETPNMTKNIDAVLEIIKHIYNTIMYAEINTMTSYCHICGCTDIKMGDDLKFHCPNCGNDDFDKMNIALRICGYISTNPFNDGRAADIHDRVFHVGMD